MLLGALYIPFCNFANSIMMVYDAISIRGMSIFQMFSALDLAEYQRDPSFNYSVIESRVKDMQRECATINGVRRAFFNYLNKPL